ncbi:hypothetical protein J8L88_04620 [Aquimarina sp. MMG015]|uniref:hypothetical protein n=1 Tax=Aquimarina sp. MMG015 TaxID=2822689 RepID=UPI001B3A453D|nr:hypothetical protein [Aquimarina sp. MMG015]MBQ4802129.1 hypothetical protein [Aquimarina sp. MMG015]
MRYISLVLVLLILSSSCANKDKKVDITIKIKSEFIEENVKWFNNEGSSSIKGIAKFKSKNGDIGFGKDFRIELNPYSAYTKERLNHIYENDDSAYVYIEDGIPKFVPDPEGYHNTRKAMCNEKGEFEFTGLPAGEYYVIAFMLWDETGGGIMQHIKLSDNETRVIEMINF